MLRGAASFDFNTVKDYNEFEAILFSYQWYTTCIKMNKIVLRMFYELFYNKYSLWLAGLH